MTTKQTPEYEERTQGEILLEAMASGDRDALVETVTALAPTLTEDEIVLSYDLATNIEDENHQASVLMALGPHLPERLTFDALSRVSSFSDPRPVATVMTGIMHGIPGERLKEAREIAQGVNPEIGLAMVTPLLSRRAGAEEVNEVLEKVQLSQDPETKAWALTTTYPYVPDSLREQVRFDALTAARSVEDVALRAFTTVNLDSMFPEDRGQRVREGVLMLGLIEDEIERVDAMIELADRLPEEFLDELLRSTEAINDLNQRRRAILYLEEARKKRSDQDADLVRDQQVGEGIYSDSDSAESGELIREKVELPQDSSAGSGTVATQPPKNPAKSCAKVSTERAGWPVSRFTLSVASLAKPSLKPSMSSAYPSAVHSENPIPVIDSTNASFGTFT